MLGMNAPENHFDNRAARKPRRGPIRKEVALTEYYLTDERWALIASRLPGKEGDPGCHGRDNRLFIEAVFWIVRTGAPWRSLPPHFGKWYTNYTRFHRWRQNGRWPGVLNALKADEACEYFYEDGVIRHAPSLNSWRRTTRLRTKKVA